MKKTVQKALTYMALATLLVSTNVVADDIIDTMEEAMSAYKKGDYVQTKEDLTYVMELLKQKKGDTIKAFLPEALEGWKAEEAKSETAGSGMLGGGATTSRVYTKDKSKVTIEVVTDSPLLQGLGSLLGNPMFNSGGKLKRINREKATVKYHSKNQSGEITIMLDKRFLITVKGSNVTEDELVAYAKAIDFKKIKEQ
jgi:ethanolamine utilization protein EutA (predicted chaperonin)